MADLTDDKFGVFKQGIGRFSVKTFEQFLKAFFGFKRHGKRFTLHETFLNGLSSLASNFEVPS